MNASKSTSKKRFTGFRILVTTAALYVVIVGLQAASSLMLPILVALFLAIIGSALMGVLRKVHVPKLISVFLVTLIVIAVFASVCLLLIKSANEFSVELPKYQERFVEIIGKYSADLEKYNIKVSSKALAKSVKTAQLVGVLSNTLKGFANALSKIVVVLIIMVFMLVEAADFREKLDVALKGKMGIGQFEKITLEIQRYLGIKTVTSAVTGFVVWGFVSLMDIDFAVLWGITAFIMNFIPFIGSILASIPAIILALIQFDPLTALIVGLGYFIINIGVSNFIEPILMGTQFGLSPLVVFLSLMVWGWIWGPVGMLLAVPLTMMLKILLEHSGDLRWFAILMGGKPKVT